MKKKQLNSKSKNPDSKSTDNGRVLFSKTHGKHKKLLIIIASIVLLAGISVGSFFAFSQFFAKKKSSTTSTSDKNSNIVTKAQAASNARRNAASKFLTKNDPQSAIEVYKDSIKSSSDDSVNSDTYIEMALMLDTYNSETYKDQILEYAYKAEKLSPSAKTATFIYNMEKKFGDTDKAKIYLDIIKERTKNDSVVGE